MREMNIGKNGNEQLILIVILWHHVKGSQGSGKYEHDSSNSIPPTYFYFFFRKYLNRFDQTTHQNRSKLKGVKLENAKG